MLYYETRLSSIISFTELLSQFTRRAPHLSCACPLITTSQLLCGVKKVYNRRKVDKKVRSFYELLLHNVATSCSLGSLVFRYVYYILGKIYSISKMKYRL